jgi:hypothetical protein
LNKTIKKLQKENSISNHILSARWKPDLNIQRQLWNKWFDERFILSCPNLDLMFNINKTRNMITSLHNHSPFRDVQIWITAIKFWMDWDPYQSRLSGCLDWIIQILWTVISHS